MPHLCIKCAHFPSDVRIFFRITHSLRRSSNPGGTAVGSSTTTPFTAVFDSHDSLQRSMMWKRLCTDPESIDQIVPLVLRRILGESWSWLGKSKLPCVRQFFSSQNSDASRRSLGGALLLNTGNHWWGVDFTLPVIKRIVLLGWRRLYSVEEYTSAKQAVRNVCAFEPHFLPPIHLHSSFFQVLFIRKCSVQCHPKILWVVNVSNKRVVKLDGQFSIGIVRT
jgi:hypothetical protein